MAHRPSVNTAYERAIRSDGVYFRINPDLETKTLDWVISNCSEWEAWFNRSFYQFYGQGGYTHHCNVIVWLTVHDATIFRMIFDEHFVQDFYEWRGNKYNDDDVLFPGIYRIQNPVERALHPYEVPFPKDGDETAYDRFNEQKLCPFDIV